ncbi:hypothetical protein [Lysobacter firmicutimachus]|uniref:HNH endonuclease 5 domain-containing protein n=1 Tax=Lysobacter firmicutimachus TaxID=1792846 RepID=A0ABU8D4U5_9GAMM
MLQFDAKPKYPPVGRCIYCDAVDEDLTDEHIVPFGLAGNSLILQKASCRQCAKITSQFELDCLRTTWGLFRNQFGMPTGKPKNRRGEAALEIGARGAGGTFEPTGRKLTAPVRSLPFVYTTPLLDPPGILLGRPPCEEWSGQFWIYRDGIEALSQVRDLHEGLRVASINPLSFGRMLAKIAHSYAVAELGPAAFSPLVRELILGSTSTMTHWVGAGTTDLVPSSATSLHEIRSGWGSIGDQSFAIVEIRLFAPLGTPTYMVVAGSRT